MRPSTTIPKPGWDALLLALLVLSHLRITSLAQPFALPLLRQDTLRHPLLGRLLPEAGIAAMGERGPWPGDPIGLVLIALTLGATFLYWLLDLGGSGRWRTHGKWLLLSLILTTTLIFPTVQLMLLRAQSGPASYTHDGGVIQTEATIGYFLDGRNPYREDYTATPMAEWGFDEYRTALYHYPYLPWTFVFSAPFFLLGQSWGGYDQRLVYLGLWLAMLLLAPRLVTGTRAKLGLVMLLALNPLMGLDLLFGQNDSFVLAWLLFSLVAWRQWWQKSTRSWLILSALLYGLACASKPTAWFFAPFYALLLVADQPGALASWRTLWQRIPLIIRRGWPALAIFALLVAPYLLWDAAAFYDDVWRWSSGQGETGYQIWGWGASNFVLAAGWVSDRFAPWPFWLLEIGLTLPILIWLMRRQQQANTLALACWHYALLLAVFFYGSRFLNENYLGYIFAFLAVGYLADQPQSKTAEGIPRRLDDTGEAEL